MKRSLAMLAAAAVLTVACSESDPGITTAVKTKLAEDDVVHAYQIDVDTADRVVTLTGTVESDVAREHAVTLARETNGVERVVDNLAVDPTATGPLDDLGASTREAARDIDAAARRAGNSAEAAARDAGATTREVAGRAAEATADAALTSVIKTKFLADSTVPASRINVDTANGVVTLTGTVASRAAADRAMTIARGTDGVKAVVDDLSVAAR